jgi:hypothetical protein
MSKTKYVSGNCYYSSEALYYILGDKKSGWEPMFIPRKATENRVFHWYLKHKKTGIILDPARLQFKNLKEIPYEAGKPRKFLTKNPSRRAKDMMAVLTWEQDFESLNEGTPE